MFTDLYNDIQRQFHSGNMVTRLIIVNAGVFVVSSLLYLFAGYSGGAVYHRVIDFLSLSSDPGEALHHFWGFITYNFIHRGFMHLLWNMLFLYWFGRIVGDLIGDKHIFPLYILGGLAGGLLYLLGNILLPYGHGAAYIVGSSAAVMSIVVASAAIAPDYTLNLLFIGRVRLKYVVLVLVFLDVISTAGVINSGGHFAHIGGAAFGYWYVYLLRKGINLSTWWERLSRKNAIKTSYRKKAPGYYTSTMRVVHQKKKDSSTHEPLTNQKEVDRILDKINKSGYDSLTDIEKETLYRAARDSHKK